MTEQNNQPEKVDGPWMRMWLQVAHSDIQWAKQQSWRGLQLTAIVMMGATVVSDRLSSFPAWALLILVAMTAAVSVVYLIDPIDLPKVLESLVGTSKWP